MASMHHTHSPQTGLDIIEHYIQIGTIQIGHFVHTPARCITPAKVAGEEAGYYVGELLPVYSMKRTMW